MTVFNDLIEELQQENLLDENNIYSTTKPKYFKGDRLIQDDNFQNSSDDFEADLLELDFEEEEENYPPPQEIVDNSIVEPPYYPYYSVSSVREANKSIKFKTTNIFLV